MSRMPNMFGGGAGTNANGLHFEQTTSLDIIEKKFQHGPGSVDEKLPNCDFKKKCWMSLFL